MFIPIIYFNSFQNENVGLIMFVKHRIVKDHLLIQISLICVIVNTGMYRASQRLVMD